MTDRYVYVVYDDPMEEETTIYGVFDDETDAINYAKKLRADPKRWGAAASSENWELTYEIKKVRLN